jgi:hypothetical protein
MGKSNSEFNRQVKAKIENPDEADQKIKEIVN